MSYPPMTYRGIMDLKGSLGYDAWDAAKDTIAQINLGYKVKFRLRGSSEVGGTLKMNANGTYNGYDEDNAMSLYEYIYESPFVQQAWSTSDMTIMNNCVRRLCDEMIFEGVEPYLYANIKDPPSENIQDVLYKIEDMIGRVGKYMYDDDDDIMLNKVQNSAKARTLIERLQKRRGEIQKLKSTCTII